MDAANPSPRHSSWRDDSALMVHELRRALAAEPAMKMVLVHEQRSGMGSVPFWKIMEHTSPDLQSCSALFREVAIPLYDDPFEKVSLRVVIHQLSRTQAAGKGLTYPYCRVSCSEFSAADARLWAHCQTWPTHSLNSRNPSPAIGAGSKGAQAELSGTSPRC